MTPKIWILINQMFDLTTQSLAVFCLASILIEVAK